MGGAKATLPSARGAPTVKEKVSRKREALHELKFGVMENMQSWEMEEVVLEAPLSLRANNFSF